VAVLGEGVATYSYTWQPKGEKEKKIQILNCAPRGRQKPGQCQGKNRARDGNCTDKQANGKEKLNFHSLAMKLVSQLHALDT
jgi:hypothetical protein